jgi:hypothetical protein
MKKSKCCGAEIKYKKAAETSIYTMLYYCSKCGKPCDTIEEVQNELQIADDAIGHDVSGTESRQVQNEEKMEDRLLSACCNEKVELTKDGNGYYCTKCKKEFDVWGNERETPTQPEKEWKEDIIKDFNDFIKKWTGENYPHLIDTDENDGEIFRQKLQSLLSQKDKEVEKAIKEEQNKLLLWWSNSTADNDYTRGFIDGIKEGLDSLSKLLKPTK